MSKRIVRDIVRAYCDPLLSKAGFVRKSTTWNRWVARELCHVVDLQLGKESDESRAALTLNFGVFEPKVYEVCWGKTPKGFIREPDCIARARVGQLANLSNLKAAKDTWWTARSGENVGAVGEQLAEAITTWGIPFLDRMHSLHEIHDFLVVSYKHIGYAASQLYLAVVKAQIGDAEGATALLREFSSPGLEAWSSRVADVTRRLGWSEVR